MAFCENCGKPVYRLDRTCANCGTPVTQFGQSAQREPESSARLNSDYSLSSPYTVMSTWGFVGSLLLMAIPLVGFVVTIVWAAGGTYNLNRRNLARGYLLLMGIFIGIYLLLFFALLANGGTTNWMDYMRQALN